MSQTLKDPDSPRIESKDQLLDFFYRGAKKRSEIGVGTEHEKFFICRGDHHVVSFDEPNGLEDIFRTLVNKDDWQPTWQDDSVIGISKDGRSITLEPGGQVELSGDICQTVFETQREFDRHMDILDNLVERDCAFMCMGLNPFHDLSDVQLVPKKRFRLMWDYLPTRGKLPHWMMKMTNTIQANFDYTSEEDAVDIVRTALLVSPIVSAIFANSPIKSRQETGYKSYRGYLWTETDPDRTGWPEFMYRKDWGFEEYLDYILDIPMFLIQRDGDVIDMTGHSFRDFIEEGYGDFEAKMTDFETHLTTAFPEIRLKQYIEVRGADGGPRSHILALPALWKGLLYDKSARRKAAALFDGVTASEHADIFMKAYRDALDADLGDRKMQDYARRLLEIASEGLDQLAKEFDHQSESQFLDPLFELVDNGRTAADQFLNDWHRTGGDVDALVSMYSL
jgi:glutamate--cysteine ligase